MVQTPVGARCPNCAKLYKLPTYRVSFRYYLRAIGAGLGTAIGVGFAWGIINWVVPFFYLNLLLAPGAGYVIGEAISLSVNRKRGRRLATIAGIALTISYLISVFLFGRIPFGLFGIVLGLLALALGIFVAVNRLR